MLNQLDKKQRVHTSCSARADAETPRSDIKRTSFMAEACLNGTAAHFIFFWKYCDSADIITEHPAHKVISVRYTKAKKQQSIINIDSGPAF